MAQLEKQTFNFAGLTLDLGLGRLTGPDGDIILRRKAFDLVRNPGRVISKDDLMAAVWQGVIVTDDSLTQCVHDLRSALGSQAAKLLQTIPRRGYMFVEARPGDVLTAQVTLQAADQTSTDAQTTGRHGSIAIMPFTCDAASPKADRVLIDGLVNDVISRLARLRALHVIARGSTFALRYLGQDPIQAGRFLGVAYVVTGRAQIRADTILIQFDIVAVDGGNVLWTEEIVQDCKDLQDAISCVADRLVQKTTAEVTAAEIRLALAATTGPLDAWQSYHAGLHHMYRFELARLPAALGLFLQSVQLDPGFARGHAAQSFCHFLRAFILHGDDRPTNIAAALKSAEDAMHVDETSPASLWAYGRALWLCRDPEGALSHLRSAIEISPSYALAHYFTGLIEAIHGNARHAVDLLDTGAALSPFDPFTPSMQIMRAIAQTRLGDLDQAALSAERAARHANAHEQILAPAAMILAEVGQMEAAQRIVGRIRMHSPDYSSTQLQRTFYGMPEGLESLFRRNGRSLGF